MIFLYTSFPDDPEDDQDGDISDEALAELDDEFDENPAEDDAFGEDEEDIDFDRHDDVDEY